MVTVFDVICLVDGVEHTYTFTIEQEAHRYAKELELKGYQPQLLERNLDEKAL